MEKQRLSIVVKQNNLFKNNICSVIVDYFNLNTACGVRSQI